MFLSSVAVHRPVATSMFILAAVLLGIVALTRLDVTLLPEVLEQELHIWVGRPDAGVPELETTVARPVEEALTGVRGVRSLHTEIVDGGVAIRLRLYPGADPELVTLGAREKLEAVRWQLPSDVEPPIVTGGSADGAAMVLALGARDLLAASEWATNVLRPRLEQIDGVARVEIEGRPRREVSVRLDPARLEAIGIDTDEVASALARENVAGSGGYLRQRGIRYPLRFASELTTAREVAGIVVARRGERPIRVRDLGTVEDGFARPDGYSRLDGESAVTLLVYREADANLLRTAEEVGRRLRDLSREFPELSVATIADPAPFIRGSISGLWQEVWMGGLLAFGVLFYFLRDLRSPVLLLTALPVSVLSSFAVLEALGLSLNLFSMGGIALSIGMLVDNSIICLENVHQHRARGLSPKSAAALGAREVALPMLASTLTTCAVFLPLAWVPGPLGALFRDMAIAVTVSLLVSLLTALTLLPLLASRFEFRASGRPRLPLFGGYHRLLVACLRRPRRFALVLGILLGGSVWVLLTLPREALPEVGSQDLEARVLLPRGSDVETTDATVREIEAWLESCPEVLRVHARIGAGNPAEAARNGRRAHEAIVRAHFGSIAERDRVANALSTRFGTAPGFRLELDAPRPELASLFASTDATLECEVTGPDPDRAEELAVMLAEAAGRDLDPAIAPLELSLAEREPRYRLDPRSDVLFRHGIDRDQATRAVLAATSGREATRLRRFDEDDPVVLRSRDSLDMGGGTIRVSDLRLPLRALFDVALELAPGSARRVDQARVAVVSWNGPLREVEPVRVALRGAIETIGLPPGYAVRFTGAYQEMSETLRAVRNVFLLSAGLVVLILAAQFESLRLPLVIFTDIPLCLIGVALALLGSGNTVNVLSGVGLVILNGIVVNDSILKVDLLRRLAESGVRPIRAVMIASRRRYRPILMTTATTVLGLLPLFFGRSAALLGPLAATIIGGLVISTILTLLVVPVLFHWLGASLVPRGDARTQS